MELQECHLILDQVRSMHNVGSVFRTSDAFGIQHLHLCGITGTPPHREIQKTALGATESVPWTYWDNTLDAVHALKNQGFKIIVFEQTPQSITLSKSNPNFPMALVFGHEVHGVDPKIIALADECWEIPQWGAKQSMNVAVTAGMAIWHLSLFR